MKKSELIDLVYDGKLDTVLDDLYGACVQRRRIVENKRARRNQRVMVPGKQVKIVGNIKPRYLLGITGKVTEAPIAYLGANKPGHVWVDIGRQVRKYGPRIRIPANCLKLVDSAHEG